MKYILISIPDNQEIAMKNFLDCLAHIGLVANRRDVKSDEMECSTQPGVREESPKKYVGRHIAKRSIVQDAQSRMEKWKEECGDVTHGHDCKHKVRAT